MDLILENKGNAFLSNTRNHSLSDAASHPRRPESSSDQQCLCSDRMHSDNYEYFDSQMMLISPEDMVKIFYEVQERVNLCKLFNAVVCCN